MWGRRSLPQALVGYVMTYGHRHQRDGAEAAHAPPPLLRVIENPSRNMRLDEADVGPSQVTPGTCGIRDDFDVRCRHLVRT